MRNRFQSPFCLGFLIIFLYLYNFPYLPDIMANEKARVYLTMAIVDRAALDIDHEMTRFGHTPDHVPVGEHIYSNKAPGVSFLGVPFYALLRAFVADPSLRAVFWVLRVGAVTIPCLLLLWVFAVGLRRWIPDRAPWATAIIGSALGTLALPYGILFMGHQLAAACVGAAWCALAEQRAIRGLWAGALAGFSILMDYQAALAVLCLAVFTFSRSRRAALAFGIGMVPPMFLVALYHYAVFGNPLETGHALTQPTYQAISWWFAWDKFVYAFFAPNHGLLVFSPWLVLALPGVVILWRTHRIDALLCSAVLLLYTYFGSSRAPWQSSWDAGPRYIACMVPFAVVPAAAALSTVWRSPVCAFALGLVAISVLVHTLTVAVLPYFPPSYSNPFFDLVLSYLAAGRVAYNAGYGLGLKGFFSVLPYLMLVAALVLILLAQMPRLGQRAMAASLLVVYFVLFSFVPHQRSAQTAANLQLNWQPPKP